MSSTAIPSPSQRGFLDVEQAPVATSTGECRLPILYRDGSLLGLVYRIPVARAAPFFEGTDLEVWPIFGAAVAMVCAWEYRDSSVGSYGEVGVGVYAKRRGSSPSLLSHAMSLRGPDTIGISVINLPVTTQAAYAAGVEIWGYPKYVTPIATRFSPGGVEVDLGDELSIAMGKSGPLTTPGFPIVTFTRLDGRLVRTVIEVDHKVKWGGASSAKLTPRGEGPTAKTVRALGLDVTPAFSAFRTDGFRAILPRGVVG